MANSASLHASSTTSRRASRHHITPGVAREEVEREGVRGRPPSRFQLYRLAEVVLGLRERSEELEHRAALDVRRSVAGAPEGSLRGAFGARVPQPPQRERAARARPSLERVAARAGLQQSCERAERPRRLAAQQADLPRPEKRARGARRLGRDGVEPLQRLVVALELRERGAGQLERQDRRCRVRRRRGLELRERPLEQRRISDELAPLDEHLRGLDVEPRGRRVIARRDLAQERANVIERTVARSQRPQRRGSAHPERVIAGNGLESVIGLPERLAVRVVRLPRSRRSW